MIALFATVAIGIIASLLFEAGRFFGQYRRTEFFFGLRLVAAPSRATSRRGHAVPLLLGTL